MGGLGLEPKGIAKAGVELHHGGFETGAHVVDQESFASHHG